MHTNANHEPIRPPRGEGGWWPRATRWATNHNWTRRGDNTKYKEKK